MILAFVGKLGKGKTLGAVIETYRFFRLGHKIFSNIELGFEHEPVRSPYDFINLNHGVFLADELWLLCDNRKSMSLMNDLINVLLLRSRKSKFHVFYTQQYLQIDVRIMYVTDYFIRPKCHPEINKFDHPDVEIEPQLLTEEIWDTENPKTLIRTIDPRPYLNLYDTHADPYNLTEMFKSESLRKMLDEIVTRKEEKELERLERKSRLWSKNKKEN